MKNKIYYVRSDQRGLLELRQVRYKGSKIEHPYDLCAVARNKDEMEGMLASVGIDAESVEWEETK